MNKFEPGENIQGFLNNKWYMGVVLDYTLYDFKDWNDYYKIDNSDGVFASFPEFLGGRPIIVDIKHIKKVKSDIGRLLYE